MFAVPAHIVSFSQRIVSPWKKNITLPCQKVGIPVPKLTWRLKNKSIKSSDRFEVDHL